LPVLRSIVRREADRLEIVLASDGPRPEHEAFVQAEHLDGFAYVLSPSLGNDLAGGQAAVRPAGGRGWRGAREGAGEHARASGESVRSHGARRGVDPGLHRVAGGAQGGGAAMKIQRPRGDRWLDRWIDQLVENGARMLARRTSRRSLLARLGAAIVGTAAFPLLPLPRAAANQARLPAPSDAGRAPDGGAPTHGRHRRRSAVGGFRLAAAGGPP